MIVEHLRALPRMTTSGHLPHRVRGGSNLPIRRYLCGHPDPFRSVRDLGLVSLGCPAGVRIIRRLSIRVAPSVAPQSQPARVRVMVFKSIGGSGLRGAAACYVSTWG